MFIANIEEDPFEKGSSSNSSPKTFASFWQGADTFIKKAQYDYILRFINIAAPCQKEIKVFGKGSGEQPFFRKVFPSIDYKRSISVYPSLSGGS